MSLEESGPVQVLSRAEHPISRRNISRSALKVLYRLHRGGYEAHLVGGGVRDLLLGRRPKDFDVATDARPERVRRMFRNSRLIGRRFRLVHVMFSDGIVEVSTFRRDPDPAQQRRGPGELLVTSDNTYGTPAEDALRRDFTVNALSYRIRDYAVADYVGGLEDLERRMLRTIGDPDVRFREDPVRMMRACELAGRLDFRIEQATSAAIRRQAIEIAKASPARLTEELLELMSCGRASPAFEHMTELGLVDVLFPKVGALLLEQRGGDELSRLLPTLDRWIEEGRQPGDGVLLSVLLAPWIMHQRIRLERRNRPPSRQDLQHLIEGGIADLGKQFALSRARVNQVYYVLETFQRLCEPMPGTDGLWRLATRPSFAEALELFELLTEATGSGEQALEEWRQAAREAVHSPPPKRRRRRRRRRR